MPQETTNPRRYPKLVAFDLDYTLWPFWIDTHISPPIRREKKAINELLDRHGQIMSFHPDVPGILLELRTQRDDGVKTALVSRTDAPKLAREALSLLLMPPTENEEKVLTASEFFDEKEIYPGSKKTHFRRIHERTGIPYSEMLFFDDESRNREVEKLGITFILVPEETGLDRKLFEKGLEQWAKRNPPLPDAE